MQSTFYTFFNEYIIKSVLSRYSQHIGISIGSQIFLTRTGKIPFKGTEIVLPITCAQRHAEEANHKAATGIGSHMNNAAKVFLVICDIWQHRIEPGTCEDVVVSQGAHSCEAL